MKEKIIELMEEILGEESGVITGETTMEELESWDSLAHVMLIGALEERLNISIPIDEAVEITSVKELLEKAGV